MARIVWIVALHRGVERRLPHRRNHCIAQNIVLDARPGIDPAGYHQALVGTQIGHAIDIEILHRQRRKALFLERLGRLLDIVVARRPVTVIAHRTFDLAGEFAERRARAFDMPVLGLLLELVEVRRDDRGEQHRQRDRPDQTDRRQNQQQLAAERREHEPARYPAADPSHQPLVPSPAWIANSSPSKSSSPPMKRSTAISRAASAGIGREK